MGNNVLIPMSLLARISDLLKCWNITKYDRTVQDDYRGVMRDLDAKMKKLQLREAYSKIVTANDEQARHSARMEYLWQKNQISIWYKADIDS